MQKVCAVLCSIVMVLIIPAVAQTAAHSKSPQAVRLYQEGLRLQENRRSYEAMQKWREATKLDPNLALAWAMLSIVETSPDSARQAREKARNLIEHQPQGDVDDFFGRPLWKRDHHVVHEGTCYVVLAFKEKSDALMKSAIENISELLDLYFKNYEDGDDEENQNSYDVLNEAWKEYCKPIMATKSKYIKLDYLAFEKGVKETMESERFAEWLKLNKEAKEKAESQEPTLTVVQDEP